ncbi:ImmA/IrrE family metallo-endopeptidase [Mesorhizobium sp. IMUNJ 23232]|uniref:ImmA/IrrE family metallo-endopeptidase n=1 Tax=Mesorhizobium sp. IMUNJ 23232 TaxID=3376064 RepID=UPI0037997518
MSKNPKEMLDLVFGENSQGETPVQRARTSSKEFVRSQVQIARAEDGGTGRRISAREALAAYGLENLIMVERENSAILVEDRDEPSRTLRNRREALNLSQKDVAKSANLREADIVAAETPGRANPIRNLEAIAQALALDERILGYEPAAKGDYELGVRLREMAQQRDTFTFSAASVLKLSESAWTISRQSELSALLGVVGTSPGDLVLFSTNYSYPAWQRGYELADLARAKIGLSPVDPIPSLRNLIERRLGIPLVQDSLDERFAGATIANGGTRGIVVNEAGKNHNVWVRRMTLAHELGHLLTDPDDRLNRLRVDEYDGIESDARAVKDRVEMRANGFAIAFLAPPAAMQMLSERHSDPAQLLNRVIGEYGVSRTAATYHLRNICQVEVSQVASADIVVEHDEWLARENQTIDYFPITTTPISRRGLFAYLVTLAEERKLISRETAATWLKASIKDFSAAKTQIVELLAE